MVPTSPNKARTDATSAASTTRIFVQDDPLTVFSIALDIAVGVAHPEPSITRACREELDLLETLPTETVRDHLQQVLLGRDVDQALQWLQEIGFIARFFPELEDTLHLQQEPGRQHKDVWEHTKQVVRQAVPRPAVRWGALFHDIGKVPTRRFTRDGVHFHGHAEVGARMFDKICRRFPFDNPLRRDIRFLIKHHLRSAQYEESWTDRAVRRFYGEMGDHLSDLLDLSRADITSKRPGRRRALLFQISALSDRVDALRASDAIVPPLPPGLGNAIMKSFALPPSRLIGDLRGVIEAAIGEGTLEAHRDDTYYIEYLRDNEIVTRLAAQRLPIPKSPDQL